MTLKSIHIFCLSFLIIGITSCQVKQTLQDSTNEKNIDVEYLITGTFKNIEIDKLGNLYLINNRNEIFKYSSDLELLFKNSYNKYGAISHVDVSNPQKTLIYFSDFQYVLFLDNTLSEIKNLNLEDLGFWDIKAVSLSIDNQIWIYDPVNFKLIKINDNGEVLMSSNEQFTGELDQELRLHAWDNEVFLFSKNKLLIFSDFGELKKTESIENLNLQIIENYYLILQEGQLIGIESKIEMLESEYIDLKRFSEPALDFFLAKDKLFVLDKNGVYAEKAEFSNQ